MRRTLHISVSTECRRCDNAGGFTLVELIAVMSVIGIMAAVCVPALSSLGSTRDSAAARQLLHDISYARETALCSGTRIWVTFDTSVESYGLFAESVSSPGQSGATAMQDPSTGYAYYQTLGVAEYVRVGIVSASFDGSPLVGFDWMGKPLNGAEAALGAAGTVMLTGGHGATVEPDTGYIRLVTP